MRARIRPLTLTVTATVALLLVGAFLVVLGIFNDMLHWDIFSRRVEAVLYGVFGSSVALAAFGVAMTLVLGTQEIVRSFRALERSRTAPDVVPQEATRRRYAAVLLGLAALMGLVVGALTLANDRVQAHRGEVFKRLAQEQVQRFSPKLAGMLGDSAYTAQSAVPRELHDLLHTLGEYGFVSNAVLFLPDPQDPSALLQTSARDRFEEGKTTLFTRMYVARDTDKAIQRALNEDSRPLDGVNGNGRFTWFGVVKGESGRPLAVLQITADTDEDLRAYTVEPE
jgi:hypothetical protein